MTVDSSPSRALEMLLLSRVVLSVPLAGAICWDMLI